MLNPVRSRRLRAAGARFAIVASAYNATYVDGMVGAAQTELRRAGAKNVELVRVPGAFEIPVVAARLAQQSAFDARAPLAIICLGVILRGETVHAAHIGHAVTEALMQIQVEYLVPVIHEVLLLENETQAKVRCLGKNHNRGTEAAQTALIMTQLMAKLRPAA